jgi:hypothetical protein
LTRNLDATVVYVDAYPPGMPVRRVWVPDCKGSRHREGVPERGDILSSYFSVIALF